MAECAAVYVLLNTLSQWSWLQCSVHQGLMSANHWQKYQYTCNWHRQFL